MRVTQLRMFALILTALAIILSTVTIATNKWHTLSYSPTNSQSFTEKSYGIFYECSNHVCKSISLDEGWRGAVIACLVVTLSALLVVFIGFLYVIMMNKNAKPLAVLLLAAAISSSAALIIYPVKMKEFSQGSLGASYYLGCACSVVSAGAGVFILATKEERIAPFVETFSNFSFDS